MFHWSSSYLSPNFAPLPSSTKLTVFRKTRRSCFSVSFFCFFFHWQHFISLYTTHYNAPTWKNRKNELWISYYGIFLYCHKESISKPASYIIYFFPETTSGLSKMCQQNNDFQRYKFILLVFILADDILYKK